MERDFGQNEYLTANYEILSNLTDRIDELLLNMDNVVELRKQPEKTDAEFVAGEISIDEALDFARAHVGNDSPTVEDIIKDVNQQNETNVVMANYNILNLQAWVSLKMVEYMSSEEMKQIPEEPMVDYQNAEYSNVFVNDSVRIERTVINGVQAKNITSSKDYKISKIDDLLLTTLNIIYTDNELDKVNIDYSPKQDDELQDWVKITGQEYLSTIITTMLLGIRESGQEFYDSIAELQQRLIAKGVSQSDVSEITFGIKNRVTNIKEDINIKGWSNAGTPTTDDLEKFINYLED